MGFPLRSNIFRSGTREQQYFTHFPIQAAVLFAPGDRDFREAFRQVFLSLDRLTGDEVVFFSVLDPPADWLHEARNRPRWNEYQRAIGESGFSYDDRPLVHEIARLFGVSFSAMPALVVGTDLWSGEFVTAPTSPWLIERQLQTLTDIARRLGRPYIGHLSNALSDLASSAVNYHPPDPALRTRLDQTYSVLDTVTPNGTLDEYRYARSGDAAWMRAEHALNRMNQSRSSAGVRRNAADARISPDNDEPPDTPEAPLAEAMLEDIAGGLVPLATVAMRVAKNLTDANLFPGDRLESENVPFADLLEEESLARIEESLRLGHLYETQGVEGQGHPLLRLRHGRGDSPNVDFSPCAQGTWKAFEMEINLSVVQAARAARDVAMPALWRLWDAHLPAERSLVVTNVGRNIRRDINLQDRNDRNGGHTLLTLGDAFYVIKTLKSDPMERLNDVFSSCLGQPLPMDLLPAWRTISNIRNDGSHVKPLSRREYEKVLELVLAPSTLGPLLQIKAYLSGRGR